LAGSDNDDEAVDDDDDDDDDDYDDGDDDGDENGGFGYNAGRNAASISVECMHMLRMVCVTMPYSAQHAQDKRVMEKLKLTHVINASNKIDNCHVAAGFCARAQ
jgi:hypothetical protein